MIANWKIKNRKVQPAIEAECRHIYRCPDFIDFHPFFCVIKIKYRIFKGDQIVETQKVIKSRTLQLLNDSFSL